MKSYTIFENHVYTSTKNLTFAINFVTTPFLGESLFFLMLHICFEAKFHSFAPSFKTCNALLSNLRNASGDPYIFILLFFEITSLVFKAKTCWEIFFQMFVAFLEYMNFKDNVSKKSDEFNEQNQVTEVPAIIEVTEVAEVTEVTKVTEAAIVTKINESNESEAVIEGTKVIHAARVTLNLAKALTEPVKDNESSDVTEATGPIDEIVLTNGVTKKLTKGQIISEAIFLLLNSSKKQTQYLKFLFFGRIKIKMISF